MMTSPSAAIESPRHAVLDAPPVHVTVEPGVGRAMLVIGFRAPAVPGTLAIFAGLLTLERLDIYSATIHKHSDGTVRDCFEVRPLAGAAPASELHERLLVKAVAALGGAATVSQELRAMRREAAPAVEFEPEIEFELTSEITTGIKVRAADRAGLLHDIAAALTANGLRTRSVTVLTIAGVARDTFRVVDADGVPPRSPELLEAVRASIVAAVR